jgi:probable F420-dependent oxidoreductase
VRVGLDLPVLTASSREAVLAYARAAESLGFDSLWTNSHTVVPVTFAPRYPYSADGRPIWNATSSWPDAMTTMAFVAAATERVRLGIAVVPLITAHPIRLAKQVATIDVLSNGRFELGVGGGWLVEEAQLGNPTDHPIARMEETIEILRLAWREPTFWKIPPVGLNPKPLQGEHVPLWIGGHGEAALRVAVEQGAGLFIWVPTAEKLAEYRKKLRARSATAPLAASLPLARVEGGRWLEAALAMRDAGADLLVIGRRWDDGTLRDLERFAKDVLPAVA